MPLQGLSGGPPHVAFPWQTQAILAEFYVCGTQSASLHLSQGTEDFRLRQVGHFRKNFWNPTLPMKTEATLLNNEKSFKIWLSKKWICRKRNQEGQDDEGGAEDGEWDLDHCDEENKEERETKQGTKKKEGEW